MPAQLLPGLVSFIESLPEPHILCDRHYRIQAANAAYRCSFGENQIFSGCTCFEVSHHFSVPCDQAGVAMFPFVMPSSSDPRSSLTVWDSVSSHLTLEVMFWAALIFTPIVIAYTGWAYKMMAGKVTAGFIEAHHRSAY